MLVHRLHIVLSVEFLLLGLGTVTVLSEMASTWVFALLNLIIYRNISYTVRKRIRLLI